MADPPEGAAAASVAVIAPLTLPEPNAAGRGGGFGVATSDFLVLPPHLVHAIEVTPTYAFLHVRQIHLHGSAGGG